MAEPTWTPTEPDADIETWVFQALGAASMCWDETPHGVFDSTRAKSIGDAMVARIRRYVLADDSQRAPSRAAAAYDWDNDAAARMRDALIAVLNELDRTEREWNQHTRAGALRGCIRAALAHAIGEGAP